MFMLLSGAMHGWRGKCAAKQETLMAAEEPLWQEMEKISIH